MAKLQKRYVCQACGSVSHRWAGQCPDCSEWNTLVEEAAAVVTPFAAKHNLQGGGRTLALVGLDAEVALPERMATGIAELDRALGGGLVEGSATLIGGDPGIGTYGVNAGARRYFGHDASRLTVSEAARIAAVLPLPKKRLAIDPRGFTRRYGNAIAARAGVVRRDGLDACLR
jgi:DNA repair protein RadA/Sms